MVENIKESKRKKKKEREREINEEKGDLKGKSVIPNFQFPQPLDNLILFL